MSAEKTRGPSDPRITVIDDSTEMLSIMAEILESAGHVVTTMSGSDATVDRVAATRPDLIILDLVLGTDGDQLSGWEYLALVRADRRLRSVPVLVCSGDVVELRSRRDELNEDPATSVLEKPFALEELEGAVARLVGASAPPSWDEERDVVLVADAQARLVSASAAALKVLGTELEHLQSLSVGDVVAHTADWTAREWERYLSSGHWEGPVTLRAVDGHEMPAISVAEIVSSRGTDWYVAHLTLTNGPRAEAVTAG